MDEFLKNREKYLLLFGAAIKHNRMALGLSQEEFAFRCGLHRTYIGSVERGERNVSLINILRICKALGCEPKDLISFIIA